MKESKDWPQAVVIVAICFAISVVFYSCSNAQIKTPRDPIPVFKDTLAERIYAMKYVDHYSSDSPAIIKQLTDSHEKELTMKLEHEKD